MASRHILVVDDEARIREVVQYALAQAGHRVSVAGDVAGALSMAKADPPALAVLDVMLPDGDGLSLCAQLRGLLGPLPVVFLSARGEEIDRVVGLEVGGDDYLSKPFSPRELVARVKAVLRRSEATADLAQPVGTAVGAEPGAGAGMDPGGECIVAGPITIDVERHEVRVGKARIELTATEFSVLATLCRRPGIVFTRGQLMVGAYGLDAHVTERTVDTHIRRIRAKFRPHGVLPVHTVHGVGYKADGSA